MRITVFGASGKVGSRVVELALRRGYLVTAVVHSQDLFVPSNNLLVQRGDIYNMDDVAKSLRGTTAVISCLGSWGTAAKDVLSSAMRAVIPAMEEQGIGRIVTLTGNAAAAPGQKISRGHAGWLGALKPLGAGKVFRDGEEHMRLLANSRLDWTAIRSPIMNNLGGSSYVLDKRPTPLWATVSRLSVATALLDQLDSDEFLGQAPFIRRR